MKKITLLTVLIAGAFISQAQQRPWQPPETKEQMEYRIKSQVDQDMREHGIKTLQNMQPYREPGINYYASKPVAPRPTGPIYTPAVPTPFPYNNRVAVPVVIIYQPIRANVTVHVW